MSSWTSVTIVALVSAVLLMAASVSAQSCCECGDCSGFTSCFDGVSNESECDQLCEDAVCSLGVINEGIPCSSITPCDIIVSTVGAPTLSGMAKVVIAALLGLAGFLSIRFARQFRQAGGATPTSA